MIQYTKEEIISSTKVSRNFSEVLNNLAQHKLNKVAVIRNNKIEAIILPISIYENIVNLSELQEHTEIYNLVNEREKSPDYVDFDMVLKENGLSIDEL